MITRAFRKEIASLANIKGRRRLGAFVVEGTKCVEDTIGYFNLRHLIATPRWLAEHPSFAIGPVTEANRGEIAEMSSLSLVADVMAVYDMPQPVELKPAKLAGQLVVALDRIQDPGNLGTIVRLSDWMGVVNILASNDTVDCFNPKAIQASMGAIARVRVIYCELAEALDKLKDIMPVYGTFLNGENIYNAPLTADGVVVMGNEGQGISDEVARFVGSRLFIPSFPPERLTIDSLNVAAATSIVLSQFRSRLMK